MTHSSASHIQGWLLSGFVLSVYVKCFLMSLFCCVWFLFVTKSIFLDYEDLLLSNAMDIENLLNQVSPEMWIRQIQFPPQLATNSLKYLWQLQQQNVSHELHTKWITEWGKLQATSIKPFFFSLSLSSANASQWVHIRAVQLYSHSYFLCICFARVNSIARQMPKKSLLSPRAESMRFSAPSRRENRMLLGRKLSLYY